MTTIDASHADTIHVFAFDGPLDGAERLAADKAALGRALGGVAVAEGRAEAIAPAGLGGLGLSTYLIEGLGAAGGPVRADLGRLDTERRPVVLLLPRGVSGQLSPAPPLAHLGSYALERARPAGGPLRSQAAKGDAAAAPEPPESAAGSQRRASGMVAMAALAAALLVAVIVWMVAAA